MSNGPYLIERLQAYQGVDLDVQRSFFFDPASGSTDPQDQTPLNISGATVKMNIRMSRDPSSTSLLALSVGSGITLIEETFTPGPPLPSNPNGVEIKITAAQLLSMNGGVPISGCYYDVLATQTNGQVLLLMCGTFDLLATVSR